MKRLIPMLTLAFALTAVAVAGAAGVGIYKNEFKDRADFKQIVKFGPGKGCKKSWKGKKTLGVSSNKGGVECVLKTPVEGDDKQPDHTIQAVGKVLKKTDKKVRSDAYVGLAVRANTKTEYELRIFPKGRRWILLKSGAKVESGKDKAIEALNKKNQLRLDAKGDRVLARVNGTKLARFKDQDDQEVTGRKTALTHGITSKRNKKALALFDKVRILVPSP